MTRLLLFPDIKLFSTNILCQKRQPCLILSVRNAGYLDDGALEADNNTGENALRPIAIGRKNYLFVGSEHGGRRAAIIYSLIRTCERHGVNAWDYLRDVLVRVATHPASQIDALLPHRWPTRQ